MRLLVVLLSVECGRGLVTRRRAAELFGVTSALTLTPPLPTQAAFLEGNIYSVKSDSTAALSPSLERLVVDDALRRLSSQKAIFLGEHHNSAEDHLLQAALITDLRKRNKGPMALGFEAVQQRYQPVLDDYCAGKLRTADIKRLTDWERRWSWPFELYEPVFRACRDANVELLALNADSEDLALVETAGFSGLSKQQLRQYVPDGAGFAAFSGTTAFKEYVSYVLAPSYAMHKQMGILKPTANGVMSFGNFYAGRMLWDTAMASRASKWSQENKDGLFIGVVGADHVKFGCGVPARYAQSLGLPLDQMTTVLLNPTARDTLRDPYNSASSQELTLQLRFAAVEGDGGTPVARGDAPRDVAASYKQGQTRQGESVLPLADLLWLSA